MIVAKCRLGLHMIIEYREYESVYKESQNSIRLDNKKIY